MWIILLISCFSVYRPAVSAKTNSCGSVFRDCYNQTLSPWTRCYEDRIVNCTPSRSRSTGFLLMRVNTSEEANVSPTQQHAVHIPSSALQRSRGSGSSEEVVLVTSVINSTYFKTRPRPPRKGSRIFLPPQGPQGVVLGELVLAVKAGIIPLRNISPPIKLIFKKNPTVQNGTCVFWKEPENENEADGWSTDGCNTTNTGDSFICSCDHLSFFAVLVNPDISVDETNARNLNYITYIGSALSVLFAFMSLFIYISLHRRRPEKATGLHMQLSAALLCLHLTFLLCNLWLWLPFGTGDGLVCRGLGLFLHWSLLATLAWLALEGFHLYLLLVRVFNIYVRRYLLKGFRRWPPSPVASLESTANTSCRLERATTARRRHRCAGCRARRATPSSTSRLASSAWWFCTTPACWRWWCSSCGGPGTGPVDPAGPRPALTGPR
ncbi:adhesion G-protein coupled receptor G1-like isoform X3 [Cololabis saira]|uniref:adhesion G-protein coupled receptor G1-like isoform X3 n=1 Tax=Cololabis saira TaxID=129043 RepID=UPI002AD26D6F|nr:adhesion G-protein coupled receptor G1-like isoform X3 [Cololabis saira]